MRQALHIFRKDARHLIPALAVVLALQVVFDVVAAQRYIPGSPGSIIGLLLLLAWWYVLSDVVHEEALPGDRQFWVTRPYSWKSLLGAKLLFVLAFVNLPVLISDYIILTVHGFSPGQYWRSMVWRQIPFSIVALLPPLALGTLTRNLGQVILALLLIAARFSVPLLFPSQIPDIAGGWLEISWIDAIANSMTFAAILTAVLLIGYATRNPWMGRAILGGFILFTMGLPIPRAWQLKIQAAVVLPRADPKGVRLEFDATRARREPLGIAPDGKTAGLAIPVRALGLPPGMALSSSGASLSINAGGRTVWSHEFARAGLERDRKGYWETITIPGEVFASTRGRPVALHLGPVVTLIRVTATQLSMVSAPQQVPDVGVCESVSEGSGLLNFVCRAPWEMRARTRVHAEIPGWEATQDSSRFRTDQVFGEPSDAPVLFEPSLSPVEVRTLLTLFPAERKAALEHAESRFVFETEHPLAHFETALDIADIRLEDFAVNIPGPGARIR